MSSYEAAFVQIKIKILPHFSEFWAKQTRTPQNRLKFVSHQDAGLGRNQKLILNNSKCQEIVKRCFKRKTGARGLQADLAKIVEDKLFDTELKI